MNGSLRETFVWMKSTYGRCAVSALVLLGASCAQPALADQVASTTVVGAESVFFMGNGGAALSFNTASAGTVTVSVTDFQWPVALDSLSFSASSQTQVLFSETQKNPTENPQKDFSISFNVGSAGAFFAQIAAIAGAAQIAGFPSIGAFSVEATFTPQITGVPLPPAVWLLLTGLLGVAGAARVFGWRELPIAQPLGATSVC
jgi:hypothetical protein